MRRAALGALLSVLAACRPGQDPPAMTEAHELLVDLPAPASWSGAQCAVAIPGARIIGDPSAWRELWKEALGPQSAPPAVDFERYFAVAAFAGARNTGGYAVEFPAPLAEAGGVVVRYRIAAPSPGGFVIQAFTQPYGMRLYRRTDKPVRLRPES